MINQNFFLVSAVIALLINFPIANASNPEPSDSGKTTIATIAATPLPVAALPQTPMVDIASLVESAKTTPKTASQEQKETLGTPEKETKKNKSSSKKSENKSESKPELPKGMEYLEGAALTQALELEKRLFKVQSKKDTLKETPDERLLKKASMAVEDSTPAYINSEFRAAQLKSIEGLTFRLDAIALFSGTDPISTAIKKVTNSDYSHSGIRIKDQNGNLWCLEITGSASQMFHFNTPSVTMDNIMGLVNILKTQEIIEDFKGIASDLKKLITFIPPQGQITDWDVMKKNYSGTVATRSVKFNDQKFNDSTLLTPLTQNLLGVQYEKDAWTLFCAGLGIPTKEDTTTLFCSEAVAYVLEKMNLLDPTIKSKSNYLPKDFSDQGAVHLQNATLGKTIIETINKPKGCFSCF